MKKKPSSQEIPIYACDSFPLKALAHLEDFLSNATPKSHRKDLFQEAQIQS